MLILRSPNNEDLDLFDDTTIATEQISPLFTTELTAESYTYPIELPASPRNRRILGFIDLPESTTEFIDLEGYQLIVENETKPCTLSIIKATNSRYTCSIFTGLWNEKTMSKKLSELDLGGNRTFADIFLHAYETRTGTFDYVFFPFHNADFYTDIQTLGIINNGNYASGEWFYFPNLVAEPTQNTLSPFVFAHYLIRRIAAELGVEPFGSFMTDTEMKTLVVDGNFALDKFEDQDDGNGGVVSVNVMSNTLNLINHVPPITVREFLNALSGLCNLTIFKKEGKLYLEYRDTITQKIDEDDWTDIAEPYPSVEPYKTKENEGFELILTPDGADEMTKDLIDEAFLPSEISAPDYEDSGFIPGPPQRGEVHFLFGSHRWAKSLYGTATYMESDSYGYAPKLKTDTNAKQSITINADAPLMVKLEDNNYPELNGKDLMPIKRQKGNSAAITSVNQFGLRFLFYRGMQPEPTNDFLYPLGSSNIYDAKGQQVGNYALILHGTNGIYQSFYKTWFAQLKKAKAVTYTVALTPVQLAQLNPMTRKRVSNNTFFIEKITFTTTKRGARKAIVRGVMV